MKSATLELPDETLEHRDAASQIGDIGERKSLWPSNQLQMMLEDNILKVSLSLVLHCDATVSSKGF